jgi:hypothetical protein
LESEEVDTLAQDGAAADDSGVDLLRLVRVPQSGVPETRLYNRAKSEWDGSWVTVELPCRSSGERGSCL